MRSLKHLAYSFLITTVLVIVSQPARSQQSTATGSIQGRVLNIESGDYIAQARVRVRSVSGIIPPRQIETFTDDEGHYWLVNIPAGTAIIEASYTGMPAQIVTVEVVLDKVADAGTISLRMGAAPAPAKVGGAPSAKDDVVQLDQFIVESKRDLTGTAIAVNSQRYADNVRSVISVDEMGFTGDGSIASALKFLPGVDLERDDYGFGNAITLSGAPSANVPVTVAGFDAITSSDISQNNTGAANQRSVNLQQISIANISRVEINRSPTPDTPGSALAGSVNMVPKSAFERARPSYNVQFYGMASQKSITLGRRTSPFSGTNVPIYTGLNLSAVVPVNKWFGFSISYLHSVSPKSSDKTVRYDTANWSNTTGQFIDTPNNPSHYMLYAYDLYDIVSTYARDGISLGADFKLSRYDTININYNQNYNEMNSGQRRAYWLLGRARMDLANSTATSFINKPSSATDTNTQALTSTTYQDLVDKNSQLQLKYRHNGRIWKAELGGSYGTASREALDLSRDLLFSTSLYAYATTIRLDNIQPWSIGKITATSNGVPVSPLDISSYVNLGNMSRTITGGEPVASVLTSLPDFRIKPYRADDKKIQAFGNISRDFFLGHTSHRVKLGFDYNDYQRDQNYNINIGTGSGYVYNGTNVSLTSFLDPGYARELAQGVGTPASFDLTKMAQFYKANQSKFIAINPGNDYRTAVLNDKYVHEKIASGYLRMDSSFFNDRLTLVYGVRFEQTKDYAEGAKVDMSMNRWPKDNPKYPGYINTNTNALSVIKQEYTYKGIHASNTYSDWFPSLNANYNILTNLIGRFSYSQTIGRPDIYNCVPGISTYPTTSADGSGIFVVTNPGLKPWKSQNISLSLELYSNNVGDITLRAYRRWVTDAFTNKFLSGDQAKAVLDFYQVDLTEYTEATVRRPDTIPGTVVTSGLELSGRYSLDQLLPAWGRGLQVKLSISRGTLTGGDETASAFAAQNMYLYPWTVGGNITLTRKYYTISLTGKWNDTQRRAYWSPDADTAGTVYEPGTYEYNQAEFHLDLDFSVRLTKKLTFFLNGRDINGYTQNIQRYGPHTPGLLKNYLQNRFESTWTAGLKASF